ncbi:RadC family protein [Lysinibacillus sp. NPDC096418]|uniref:JAB domain-containing protein n=1 Tax=Lysinibacillus sp. NPDC096418 TaxID=3364138 RepID=UPI00382DB8D0
MIEKMLEVVSIRQVTRKTKNKYASFTIRSPRDLAEVAHHFIGNEANEVFIAIMLNTKNQVIGVHRVSTGSLNSSIVHPRESFKAAILNNAASICFAHQHPSGIATESPEDIEVTKRLLEVGYLLGIEVLDHVIVTEDSTIYVSLKEKGYF